MRFVRAALTVGWVLLIVSLFWDPVTPELTRHDNLASPFHLKSQTTVAIQGQVSQDVPYQMSNRIFWTMIIPILPLFFMVAGHEAWRRICPLSFVSQIPRYLGWNRRQRVLIRRTGQVEQQLALVGKNSWWRRNIWYIQFGLLYLALNARILFVNSDRTALALFFIGVILLALWVGYMWGGKSWCNYVCPIAIVQKIYTEPRGLLESQAHVSRKTITQSMCRAPGPSGDVSICVGCTTNCPDIDLERSYWESIEDPSLRNVYYGFFGLVVGFYTFYFLYAGSWDYYFSGAWTHEADQLGRLLGPGLYINGMAIGIPKLLSAPLVLALFVGAAMLLGKTLEAIYRRIVARLQLPLTEPEIISRCLSFSAYLTINVFYLFGGRPNLLLLPPAALRVVDILIVALTTLWFLQAVQRNPMRYRREGLASSLIEQLRKLKVDISKFLEGRKLEELKADEVYVLAKTLPSFSREQRLQAYRNILEDAIRTGRTDSSASLELLREVRVELGITDDDHRQLRNDLGIETSDNLFDPQVAATYESWLRVTNYRSVIEPLLLSRFEQGLRLQDVLADAEVSAAIRKYREMYQISEVDHASVLSTITGSGGLMFERARRQLELLAEDSALVFGLQCRMLSDPQWRPIGTLLIAGAWRRATAVHLKLFSILLTLGNTADARAIAMQVARLSGREVESALALPVSSAARATWTDSLDSTLVNLLLGGSATEEPAPADPAQGGVGEVARFRQVVEQGTDLSTRLRRLVEGDDQLVAALALTGISYLDIGMARQLANEVARRTTSLHWLLAEIVESLTSRQDQAAPRTARQAISLTVASPNAGQQQLSYLKDFIAVGRSQDNDVVVMGPEISSYHLAVCREGGRVEVRKTDPFAPLFVNGRPVSDAVTPLEPGARIGFTPATQAGTVIVVNWEGQDGSYSLEHQDTITKLMWLSQVRIFRSLELHSLAEIAASAEVRRYRQGAWLCRAGDSPSEAFILHSGQVDIVALRDKSETVIGSLSDGAIVGELGVITSKPRAASVRISSGVARIVTIHGERLRWLMERDASVSMSMLTVVAGYVTA